MGVKFYGVEAAGEGIETGKHAASLNAGDEGVSKPAHVQRIVQIGADGVIVGSAFVNIIHKYPGDASGMLKELETLARDLKEAQSEVDKKDKKGMGLLGFWLSSGDECCDAYADGEDNYGYDD